MLLYFIQRNVCSKALLTFTIKENNANGMDNKYGMAGLMKNNSYSKKI